MAQQRTAGSASVPLTLQQALQPSNEPMVITEAHAPFRILHVNPAWCHACGYEAEEAIGQSCSMLQGASTCRSTLGLLRHALDRKRSFAVRLVNYTKQGRVFVNTLQVAPLTAAEGRVGFYAGFLSVRYLDEEVGLDRVGRAPGASAWARLGGDSSADQGDQDGEEGGAPPAQLVRAMLAVQEGTRQLALMLSQARLTHETLLKLVLVKLLRRGALSVEGAKQVISTLLPAMPLHLDYSVPSAAGEPAVDPQPCGGEGRGEKRRREEEAPPAERFDPEASRARSYAASAKMGGASAVDGTAAGPGRLEVGVGTWRWGWPSAVGALGTGIELEQALEPEMAPFLSNRDPFPPSSTTSRR